MSQLLAKDPIFGRTNDLKILDHRIQKPGLTVLAARPQQGKTLLLRHFVDRLRQNPDPKTPLVGYFESQQTADDHLLYAIQDLYRTWIESASFLEQGKSL